MAPRLIARPISLPQPGGGRAAPAREPEADRDLTRQPKIARPSFGERIAATLLGSRAQERRQRAGAIAGDIEQLSSTTPDCGTHWGPQPVTTAGPPDAQPEGV